MTLAVHFPDGSIRKVAGQLKAVSLPGPHQHFIQVPVNCDPLWRYENSDGQWRAVARYPAHVARLEPRVRAWWHSIVPMIDDGRDSESCAAA